MMVFFLKQGVCQAAIMNLLILLGLKAKGPYKSKVLRENLLSSEYLTEC